MACAEAAKARTKARALNLIIAFLLFDIGQKSRDCFFGVAPEHVLVGKNLIWINACRVCVVSNGEPEML